MKSVTIGQRVRLTGEFLRNTGQLTGSEGLSRWTVVACPCGLCKGGRFCAVDQPSVDNPAHPRHFNVSNLEKAR